MKPGRELDALIAEKVMGLTIGWKRYSGTTEWGQAKHYDWFRGGPKGSVEKFPNIGTDSTRFTTEKGSNGVAYKSLTPEDYQEYGWVIKGGGDTWPLRCYSTDIAAAFEVVEKLQRWKLSLTWEWDFDCNDTEPGYFATAIFDPVLVADRAHLLVKADTVAHAICLAALKVVELLAQKKLATASDSAAAAPVPESGTD